VSTILCIGYFHNGIWEKASAKCGNNPEFLNPYPGNLVSSPEQGQSGILEQRIDFYLKFVSVEFLSRYCTGKNLKK